MKNEPKKEIFFRSDRTESHFEEVQITKYMSGKIFSHYPYKFMNSSPNSHSGMEY